MFVGRFYWQTKSANFIDRLTPALGTERHTLKTLAATRHCISAIGAQGPMPTTQSMIASVWCCRSGTNMNLYRFASSIDTPRNASCLMNGNLIVYPAHAQTIASALDNCVWSDSWLKYGTQVIAKRAKITSLHKIKSQHLLWTTNSSFMHYFGYWRCT